MESLLPASRSDVSAVQIVWGSKHGALLRDPVLSDVEPEVSGEPVGYPYWDDVFAPPPSELHNWFGLSAKPVVLITMGSFLGARGAGPWEAARRAVIGSGARALLVGPKPTQLHQQTDSQFSVGGTAMSTVLPFVRAVVHHGGIGTTHAVLRAGRPSVVLPQAFDQSFNGRSVAAIGAGLMSTEAQVAADVFAILDEASFVSRAAEAMCGMRSTSDTVQSMVASVAPHLG